MPKLYVRASWDNTEIAFQDAGRLDVETQTIEHRAGNSPVFSTVKKPGLAKSGNVVLKKGIFAKDNAFWDWFTEIKINTISRGSLTTSLPDERGAQTLV
ncbi:phage tail protein [uncultured Tateyamaria sp.]|uniref:phage tail protein n=1 Tax=uncultured Tateyamaria sp. TaxID=455651 RepID=UPI0026380FFB|nr:phage tail protein [uncultured Tateyamaria sp.]